MGAGPDLRFAGTHGLGGSITEDWGWVWADGSNRCPYTCYVGFTHFPFLRCLFYLIFTYVVILIIIGAVLWFDLYLLFSPLGSGSRPFLRSLVVLFSHPLSSVCFSLFYPWFRGWSLSSTVYLGLLVIHSHVVCLCVVSSPDYLQMSLLMASRWFQQAGWFTSQGLLLISPTGTPWECWWRHVCSPVYALCSHSAKHLCCHLCLKCPRLANFYLSLSFKWLMRPRFLQEVLLTNPTGRAQNSFLISWDGHLWSHPLWLESILIGQLRPYGRISFSEFHCIPYPSLLCPVLHCSKFICLSFLFFLLSGVWKILGQGPQQWPKPL